MDLTERLAALDNRLYRSTAALAQGLAAGEFDVAWNFTAHRPVKLMKDGAPVNFVFADPVFGLGITYSVAKGAPPPSGAARSAAHRVGNECVGAGIIRWGLDP